MDPMKLDGYTQRGRELASDVARLKGWIGNDPARAGELAEALNALTAHRLLGRGFTEAVADAQEAVTLAGRALAQAGPLGPYAPPTAAAALFAATVHLATIQSAAQLPEAAAQTFATAEALRSQVPLDAQVPAATGVLALLQAAHAGLVAGDLARANAWADGAVAVAAGLAPDDDSFLPLEVHRVVAECRWAAGLGTDAVTHSLIAVECFGDVALDRLLQPGRLNEALLARLTEPAYVVYSEAADRLIATGDVDAGLTTRRELVGLLAMLVDRGDDVMAAQLAQARADLAADLERGGRFDEAELLRRDPRVAALAPRPALTVPGTSGVAWLPLGDAEVFGRARPELVARRVREATVQLITSRAGYEAGEAAKRADALAELERLAAVEREVVAAAAARGAAERRAADEARAVREREEALAAEGRAEAEAAERAEAKQARIERKEAYRLEAEQREIERLAAQRSDAKRREP